MFDDFKELLSALNASKVKYLVVGGYAVSYHAQPRNTKDLDIFVLPTSKNGAALIEALQQFGAPLAGMTAADFIEKGKFFRMGRPPMAIDILPEISGVDFNSAWKRRVGVTIDEATGMKAHFISSDDLIAAKLAAGRPQDLADVDAIRKAGSTRKPVGQAPKRRGPKEK